MDLSMLSAAYTGAKFAKEALAVVLQYKIDEKAKEKINEVLEKLGPIQDTLFELREELFRLQDENRALKENIKSFNDWNSRLSRYKLIETEGGAVVYSSLEPPSHYVCPSCIEKKEIQILQNSRTYSGTFQCPGCDKTFPIKKKKSDPVLPPRSGAWT
jgi:predicted RNA-binding Zn-ribbon protein involved in translation (DUF1610 family)